MLLLLPILVPLIGGIFVFRQKNETYRDWLVRLFPLGEETAQC